MEDKELQDKIERLNANKLASGVYADKNPFNDETVEMCLNGKEGIAKCIAQSWVGREYAMGVNIDVSMEKAKELMDASLTYYYANESDFIEDAFYGLIGISTYSFARCLVRDERYDEAFEYMKKAEAIFDEEAIRYQLSEFYLYGIGTKIDLEKAKEYADKLPSPRGDLTYKVIENYEILFESIDSALKLFEEGCGKSIYDICIFINIFNVENTCTGDTKVYITRKKETAKAIFKLMAKSVDETNFIFLKSKPRFDQWFNFTKSEKRDFGEYQKEFIDDPSKWEVNRFATKIRGRDSILGILQKRIVEYLYQVLAKKYPKYELKIENDGNTIAISAFIDTFK